MCKPFLVDEVKMQLEELEKANRLFELYNSLLSPAQKDALEQFLQNGFEVTEIAINAKSTKQAVSKNIKVALKKLAEIENNLQFLAKQDKLKMELIELSKLAENGKIDALKKRLEILTKEI